MAALLYLALAAVGVVVFVAGFTMLLRKLNLLPQPRFFTKEERAYIDNVRKELAARGRKPESVMLRDEIIVSDGFKKGLDYRAFIEDLEPYVP